MTVPSSRLTLSGAFLGIAITAGLFAQLFSAYWLILAGAALLAFTQSWSFDLARVEQRLRGKHFAGRDSGRAGGRGRHAVGATSAAIPNRH